MISLWGIYLFSGIDSSLFWSWALQIFYLLDSSFRQRADILHKILLLVLISLFPFILSTRLIFNPHSFLLPSFLRQHILFTEASIYQGCARLTPPMPPFCLQCQAVSSWMPALGSCQSLGPAVLLLPEQAVAQGEMERLHTPSFIARDQPYLSFPSLVQRPDSPAAFCVNLNSLVGRTFDLGHPGREQQFPWAVEEQSGHSWEMLAPEENWQTRADSAACLLSFTPFPLKDVSLPFAVSFPSTD